MRPIPLEVILSWPKPNYVNPETRGVFGGIIATILLVLATVILGIRLYARKRITHGFGIDDILIIIAWIPATAFGVCGYVAQYSFQWGHHVWDVPVSSMVPGIQLSIVQLILFDVATSFTKLSMLALIFRIAACSTYTGLRLLCQVIGAVISVNGVIFVLVILFQCRPFSDNWKIDFINPSNCSIDENAHLLAAGIINTTTDFIMVLLPIGVVYKFQELPRRQLIAVNMLFAVGLLACIAGVVRTYFTWIMGSDPTYDRTWHGLTTWLFSAIELYISLICASVPASKPFFNRYVPRMMLSGHRSRSSKATNSKPGDIKYDHRDVEAQRQRKGQVSDLDHPSQVELSLGSPTEAYSYERRSSIEMHPIRKAEEVPSTASRIK